MLESKFQQFQTTHNEAVSRIREYLEPGEYEPQMDGLVKWMMETDANPYSYLPETWANATYTATGFKSLLDYISHALYDDGDIAFVSVNGEPRIVFANRHDDNFREVVLNDDEKFAEKRITRRPVTYTLEVLDITPNEFGVLVDAYETKRIKECFVWDAAKSNSIDTIAKHYRGYKCWDESWITDLADRIGELRDVWSRYGMR